MPLQTQEPPLKQIPADERRRATYESGTHEYTADIHKERGIRKKPAHHRLEGFRERSLEYINGIAVLPKPAQSGVGEPARKTPPDRDDPVDQSREENPLRRISHHLHSRRFIWQPVIPHQDDCQA